ncbi:hypothetical protein QO010_004278 [Caulobacter ginsengisoli]|uniref:Uncharacterized protein n=1 Tax=Caulobacter ginsengisoli TaxID=400775 RepID=A0ABU0IZ75_9CAUL|nr:hypothetical protein [Caulobacter ginsengisoli]MDQ0466483.1 hypothetical protein [Caulobacter ginsengisoli]
MASWLMLALVAAAVAQGPWPAVRPGDSRAQVTADFPSEPSSIEFADARPGLNLPDQQLGGEQFAARVHFDGQDRVEDIVLQSVKRDTGVRLEALTADLRQRLGGEPVCHDYMGYLDSTECGWNIGDIQVSLMYLDGIRYITIAKAGPLRPARR